MLGPRPEMYVQDLRDSGRFRLGHKKNFQPIGDYRGLPFGDLIGGRFIVMDWRFKIYTPGSTNIAGWKMGAPD